VTKESSKKGYLSLVKPCDNDQDGVMHVRFVNLCPFGVYFFCSKLNLKVVPIQTNIIRSISSIRIFLSNNLQSVDSRMSVWKSLRVKLNKLNFLIFMGLRFNFFFAIF